MKKNRKAKRSFELFIFDFPLQIYLALNKNRTRDLRRSCCVFSGITGVIVNALLAGVKFTVAVLSGSVAVAADAVNNLADAASSLVTVIGFKLAGKPADEEHPFGHGRVEYIAGIIVSVIIIATGLSFLKESVVRIFSPGSVEADPLTLLLLAAAIVCKLWLGGFFFMAGKKTDAPALRAAGIDSLSDCGVTLLVLVSMFVGRYTHFPVDGVAGSVVAVLVIVSGGKVLKEIADPLIGTRPKKEMVEELVARLISCPGIRGVHDCIIHNYGPELYFATAHAEVDCKGTLVEMHDILENAEVEIAKNMPVRLVLHCDPFTVDDPAALFWRRQLENAASALDERFKIYDFRYFCGEDAVPDISFHLLVNRSDLIRKQEIIQKIRENLPQDEEKPLNLDICFVTAYV